MDCGELVPAAETRKYGNHVKCCECHSSYRFCRDNVGNWNKLTPEEKSTYIKNNKGQGGRGKKRELVTSTSVRFSTSVLFHVGSLHQLSSVLCTSCLIFRLCAKVSVMDYKDQRNDSAYLNEIRPWFDCCSVTWTCEWPACQV